MTKEELLKEAYEWTEKNISVGISMYNPSIEMYCGKAYKDSAEPREKRIEELEYQLTHRNCLDCSNHSSNLRMRNLELEKENAELKRVIDNDVDKKIYVQLAKKAELADVQKEQLTKAKEIVKMLHSDCYSIAECEDTNLGLWEDDLAKAEAFLKE